MARLLAARDGLSAHALVTSREGGVSRPPYDALGDEVRVTVIAAGFDGGKPRPRTEAQPQAKRPPAREPDPVTFEREPERPSTRITLPDAEPPRIQPPPAPPAPPRPQPQPAAPRRTIVFDDTDDLDVPDFLK